MPQGTGAEGDVASGLTLTASVRFTGAAELVITLTNLSSPNVAGIATYPGASGGGPLAASGDQAAACAAEPLAGGPGIDCDGPQPIPGPIAADLAGCGPGNGRR